MDARAVAGLSAAAEEVLVRGVVQGVGFRPFVHRLALRHGLGGWVRNEAGSVRIHVEGQAGALDDFAGSLEAEAPPLATIDGVLRRSVRPRRVVDFRIVASETRSRGRLPVSPDVALCEACEAELRDPTDRRHRYAFITCTDCGPRYTVIESMPYDRERSSMRHFPQCPACEAEYRDPGSRRYHSETNSCPECGPRVWLTAPGGGTVEGPVAVAAAAAALAAGRIVAVRGLGGFHLAVDATDEAAVRRLRGRKARDSKPLALMVADLDGAERLARVAPAEAAVLSSRRRPIVLLEKAPGTALAPSVAPGLDRVGVMLAYTPLHLLLLEEIGGPLVMTSGNPSDRPIVASNEEALERLSGIADLFLLHDREIVARCDDSVVRVVGERTVLMRRARGWAPLPLRLPVTTPRPLVALGPHLKNTFTLAAGDRAYVSPHVGDLDALETLEHFRRCLARYRSLFRIEPEIAVRDLHPGYLSTREAEAMDLERTLVVQHHHAHVAAVLAEHGEVGPALGVAFDGTGYGDDGRVWGAELLVSTLRGYRRRGRLRYAPLPGGDLAARTPWRTAMGFLSLEPDAWPGDAVQGPVSELERRAVLRQLERGVNAPLASSMGRLFDAAASLLGVCHVSGHEGQAAMELEALAGRENGPVLPLPWSRDEDGVRVLDPIPLLAALVDGRRRGLRVAVLAAGFHASVCRATVELGREICEEDRLDTVVLAGGCFQNARLLEGVAGGFRAAGLRVLAPRDLGPGDGAISYGQAAVAAALIQDTAGGA